MLRLILLVSLLLPSLASAANVIKQGRCEVVDFTSAYDEYWGIGNRHTDSTVSIAMEPDWDGTGATATLTLSMCSVDDTPNSCEEFDFDSTGNGVPDTNVLGGTTPIMAKLGLKGIEGFMFLRVQGGAGGSENPQFTICRHASHDG